MYLSSFFNYYKIGRFIFGLTLLIAFQIAGLPYAMPSLRNVLVIYIFIVLVRLTIASEKINYFDFLFDVVFVSAMVYISHGIYSYLTFIYLFPIFFSSVLIRTRKYFIFPVISLFLYGGVYYSYGTFWERESILTISLHFFAFILIALAGGNLKGRMEHQARYIKKLEEERIRMQGYERLYRVSADLAHELRNPLASISAAVQFLSEGRSDREFIEMLSTETGRLTRLVNDFLLFSRPSDAPKEEVDVREMLKVLTQDRGSGKEIVLEGEESATVVANRTFMEVALHNIIKNAVEAARTLVKVSLSRGSGEVRIEVEDDGRGVEAGVRDTIFEPFVTTKTNGTGLGLAIAYRIVTSFGGDIEVGSSPLQGARFSIILPLKN
ncbi:MAG: ATP-binding protein [Thermodesulfovibrionales bacterium]